MTHPPGSTPQDPVPPPPAPFGACRPSWLQERLIRACHRQRYSWLGRRLALALRKLVLATTTAPLDYTVRGLRARFHLHDNVSERKFLFTPQFYDTEEFAVIERTLPADGVFVDIGANVGLYSLWAAQRLGPGGRVLAIEPNPAALERLTLNIAFNGLGERITVVPNGVADREGVLRLHLDRRNMGRSSLKVDTGEHVDIACRPLLDLLRDHGAARIDILKIDVEGAEDLVLVPFFESGARGLFPRRIIIERSDGLWQTDLLSHLAGLGYRVEHAGRMNYVLERAEAAP